MHRVFQNRKNGGNDRLDRIIEQMNQTYCNEYPVYGALGINPGGAFERAVASLVNEVCVDMYNSPLVAVTRDQRLMLYSMRVSILLHNRID